MGNFLGWLARMSDALATPDPNTGQSPLDSIQGALAVVGAAAHNPAGLEALQEQRQSQQAAKDYNLRQQQVQNQSILARQNAVREQAVADAQVKHLNAQTDQITNPQEKPGEIWKMSDAVDPATGNLLMYEEHSGQTKVTNFKPKAPTNPSEQPLGADRVSQLNSALQQRFNVLILANRCPPRINLLQMPARVITVGLQLPLAAPNPPLARKRNALLRNNRRSRIVRTS